MNRLVLVGALLAGACGSATDDRPATLEYITDTILAPSCATAECHSAFVRQVGDEFDTTAAARQSIVANGLATPANMAEPDGALLIQVLTVGAPSILSPGSGNVRMPYDAPMPDADVELIRQWIRAGVPNAQCVANSQGLGCQTRLVTGPNGMVPEHDVVKCSPDGTAGDVVQVCGATQTCDFYAGNGQCT